MLEGHDVVVDSTQNKTWWGRFCDWLGTPVDGASLAVFRIVFGLIMAWHGITYLLPVAGKTLLERAYTDVGFLFPYPCFEWIRLWPQPFLTCHFIVFIAAGLAVAVGWFYRTAAVLLFLTYTYIFLLDETRYNNHYYLMSLLAFLLIWMPAQKRFALDTRRSEEKLIPFWPVFLLRAQLFIVYFYGGIAKINSDWLTAVPMYPVGMNLRELVSRLVPVPDFLGPAEFAYFIAYTGLVYDLLIGFLLICRRTRFLAIVLTAIFHGTNHFLFPIGVFPFLAFGATLIFLEPDWPVRVWNWLKRPRLARPDFAWLFGGAVALPVVGAALGWKQKPAPSYGQGPRPSQVVCFFVVSWIVAHFLLPLRHYAIPGDANWTEEGHKFSWRMMLRSKHPAHLVFRIVDPEIKVAPVNGSMDIDWNLWPKGEPRVLHVAVNSRKLNWEKLPELAVIYENGIGERLVYNPYAGGKQLTSAADYRKRINQVWWQTFGRQPAVYEAIPPVRCSRTGPAQSRAAANTHPARILRSGAQRSEQGHRLQSATSTKGNGPGGRNPTRRPVGQGLVIRFRERNSSLSDANPPFRRQRRRFSTRFSDYRRPWLGRHRPQSGTAALLPRQRLSPVDRTWPGFDRTIGVACPTRSFAFSTANRASSGTTSQNSTSNKSSRWQRIRGCCSATPNISPTAGRKRPGETHRSASCPWSP
ncbi:MAG: hypothetical protein KatS3mg105_1935 [Gemmatales bacterium]|nr:MAG: hypothetical protein KatS3mg105_1935 [Gemmatales bacterium]